MELEELNKVGWIVSRRGGSWRETVRHYAQIKNCVISAIDEFDKLVADGCVEPWAALKALADHGAVDLIMNKGTYKSDQRTLN